MNTGDHFPHWLKAMENGSIGEARTRSFLLDRFWVLERSVDIDGADFIIQRRLTSSNLLDKSPPRFGIVQAKFFESPKTNQVIPLEYLIDREGVPRKEFFLLCHTGKEEHAESYYLTAEDLVREFSEKDGKIRVPGSSILGSAKYKIESPRFTLDRMERALAHSDFAKNRHFVSWFLPNARPNIHDIDPLYLEPIDNGWGDIPEGFFDIKKAAEKGIFDLDDVKQDLVKIVEESDPEKALSVARDLYRSLRGGGHLYITIPDDIYNEDLHTVVQEHKRKVMHLREQGILDSFLAMKVKLEGFAQEDLRPHMPLGREAVYSLDICYDPETLQNVTISSTFSKANQNMGMNRHWSGWIESAAPGHIVYCSIPGYGKINVGGKHVIIYFLEVLNEIYEMRFPEETN